MDADLTASEAAAVLDPPLSASQIRMMAKALGWEPSGHRHTGRAGHPHPTYPAAKIMSLHRALVDSGCIELFFGRATHPRIRTKPMAAGDPQWIKVEFYAMVPAGEVVTGTDHAEISANLMRAFGFTAIDGLTISVAQGKPSEEDKIRDAMTEATEHPGRMGHPMSATDDKRDPDSAIKTPERLTVLYDTFDSKPTTPLIPTMEFAARLSASTGRRCSILDPLTMLAWNQANDIPHRPFALIPTV